MGAGAALSLLCAGAAAAQPRTYNIPAESLSQALRDYGHQAGQQLIFTEDLVRGRSVAGVRGAMEPADALSSLLVGSGLRAETSPSGVVMIVRRADQNPPGAAAAAIADVESIRALDEVVVTGTHIRGVLPVGPVTQLDRHDLERGGFVDVAQALQSIPINFSGGLTAQASVASNTGDGAENNFRTGVTSPNLRGLGASATLTLVNGKRLPPAGLGLSVDLSMIPLAAVERIDVVADGASAIYGADAVAGVVNIITRRRYDGVEARLQRGGAQGGLGTTTESLLAGGDWRGLSGVAGVEHFRQSRLSAAKRDASRLSPLPFTLLGDEDRTSYFGSLTYQLSPRIRLLADGLYLQRIGDSVNTNVARTSIFQFRKSSQYLASLGLQADLGHGWTIDTSGTWDENVFKYPFLSRNAAGISAFVRNDRENQVHGFEARASGPLLETFGGPLQAALGGAYREERLSSRSSTARSANTVRSAFAEVDIPLVGARNRVPLVDSFRLTLAERMDDYDAWGQVSVPKVAAAWRVSPSLELSTSYSKSFRAPSLFDLVPPYFTQFRNIIDPASPGGVTRGLVMGGSGRAVGPERATNLNFTASYRPEQAPGLELTLTYFKVDYRERIANPDPNTAFALNLTGAPADLLTRSPSVDRVNSLLAGSISITAQAGVPIDATAVRTIVDLRNTNIAASHIAGLQGSARYRMAVGPAELTWSEDLSYLYRFTDQLRPGSIIRERAGTIFSPPKFRSRAGAEWSQAQWSVSVFWNHTDGYADNRVIAAPVGVDAYNTFDASVALDLDHLMGRFGQGAKLILSATNLTDQGPPAILPVSTASLLMFDPTNASIVGRFVSVELVKRW